MSDSSSSISTSYWNGELVWSVNSLYRWLINVDPDTVPYIDKLSLSSFFLKSRKWYVGSLLPRSLLADKILMDKTTDIVKVDTTWCWWWDCYWLYYQVSDDKTQYRVVRRDCDDCDQITFVEEWTRCSCDADKFIEIKYPIWWVIKEWYGKQKIEDSITYKFEDSTFQTIAEWWDVRVGDYILFYAEWTSDNPWQCWIYRQINGVFNGYITLDTWYDWVGENANDWYGVNVWYKIFRNVWPTVWRVGNWWLNVYHWLSDITTQICWARWGCIQSIVNHNNMVTVLTEQWYVHYSWIWENILYFNGLNTINVWTDKINMISYWDFLVVAWTNYIESIIFSEDNKYAYSYNIWWTAYEKFWIYSKDAMSVFDNGLFVIGNDKRLYVATIEWSTTKYYLKLTSQSDTIFNELDLLQEWDNVSLSSYQNKLYLFINGRGDVDDELVNKTKILIYNKDYKLRYTHIIPRWVIHTCKYGIFLGDGLFQYIWDRDIYMLWTEEDNFIHQTPIKSEIIFDIVNSENHWIVNGNGNRVSLMTNKKLKRMKSLLWMWKYTDNTYIEIESFTAWYRFHKRINWFNSDWIDNINEYYDGSYSNINIAPCFTDRLSSSDNMNNKCNGSHANTDVREELHTPVCHWTSTEQLIHYEPKRFDDYAICYNDKWYQLSPIQHIYINPQIKYPAILYTVHIVSDNYDRLNFGWVIVEYDSYPIWYKEKTSFDVDPEVCYKKPTCPNQNCS